LAEFVAMSMLMFTRDLWRLERYQKRKHWERYTGSDLHGRTLAIVGVGRVGSEVARVGKALGMTVIGTKVRPAPVPVDQLYKPAELHAMLPRAEFLVLSAPHTPETEKLIGAREFALLPKGAVFINIARGAEVDEPALVEALQTGHLKGAVLDVFAVEPLPVHHPLWEMPNVLISPHSASTSDRENERITEIFIDNLRRFLAGKPLRNVLDLERLY
jgi:phosphoglycerate dehydrogenase-like enzyme